MAILGHNAGADTVNLSGAFVRYYGPFSAPATGTVQDLTWKIFGNANYTAGIYSDNAGSPDSRLGQSAGEDINEGTGAEHTFTMTAAVNVSSGTSYWLALGHSAATLTYYAADAAYDMKYESGYSSGALPATASSLSTFADAKGWSYGTITEGGGTTRGKPFGHLGNAFNGGRTLEGIIG